MKKKNQKPPDSSLSSSQLLANRKLAFEKFEFFPQKQQLLYQGKPCAIEPKMLQLLALLIEKPSQVISKEELVANLWPDSTISNWSLARLISDTRNALEVDGRRQSIIKTVRGKGYSFVAEIEEVFHAYSDHAHANSTTDGNPQTSPPVSRPYKTNQSQDKHRFSLKPIQPIMLTIGIILTTLGGLAIYNYFFTSLPVHQLPGHNQAIMVQIQKNLRVIKESLYIQESLRQKLDQLLIANSPEKTPLSSERRIRLHYPHFGPEEQLIFNQLREITEGPLYRNNRELLGRLANHPELYQEIETLYTLYNHLIYWMNKYNRNFLSQPDSCFVIITQEEGIPFPSDINDLVDQWIKKPAIEK